MGMLCAVSFNRYGRLYYFQPGDLNPQVGDRVLVPTDEGPEVAECVWPPQWVSEDTGGEAADPRAPAADEGGRDRSRTGLRRAAHHDLLHRPAPGRLPFPGTRSRRHPEMPGRIAPALRP